MTQIKSRRCVACNEYQNGREMLRIIKDSCGNVKFDSTGRLNGRGAYVCNNAECVQKAVKTNAFTRSLHVQVPEEAVSDLLVYFEEKSIE